MRGVRKTGGRSGGLTPMRLSPETRSLIASAMRRGINISKIAQVFGVSQKTVSHWAKRKRFSDKPRTAKRSKLTIEVELAILSMRTTFRWGCARIQQGLFCLPEYVKTALQNTVQEVKLSRSTINNVLKKHKLNGYLNEAKKWKFFRAKEPDELWQLDLKGPFTVQGKKYWWLVCIDDYSRFLLLAEQFEKVPGTKEIAQKLESIGRTPKNILTDNAKQFAKQWKRWCAENSTRALYAHPYYPQDKGKVERTIRNISEEFINLLTKFPHWLNGTIQEYKKWYNHSRFHRGIGTVPSALYKEVRNLT